MSGRETDGLFKGFANFFLGLVPIFVLLHSTPTSTSHTVFIALWGQVNQAHVKLVLLSLALQNTCSDSQNG